MILLAFATAFLTISGCQKAKHPLAPVKEGIAAGQFSTLSAPVLVLSQGFETGASSPKTAYDVAPTGVAGDNVTLSGASWNMFDALIGNLSGDKKAGSWSARIRNIGKITMLFDLSSGVSTVNVKHAIYGTDGASQWGLWYSQNAGSSWTQGRKQHNRRQHTANTILYPQCIGECTPGNTKTKRRK